MIRHSPRVHGFTLFEVLVALAVVAIGLSAAIKVASSHINNTAYLQEKTFAHYVGMNILAEWQLAPQWPGSSRKTGTALMAKAEWRWSLETMATPDPNIRRVEVSVYFDEQDEKSPLARVAAFYGKPR